jgi:hypothetical protein
LKIIQEKVRERKYRMSIHAEEEMCDNGLALYDVEHGILTGKILERQKDAETAEWKYCIRGETIAAGQIEVVAKLSLTGQLVIITVYVP